MTSATTATGQMARKESSLEITDWGVSNWPEKLQFATFTMTWAKDYTGQVVKYDDNNVTLKVSRSKTVELPLAQVIGWNFTR